MEKVKLLLSVLLGLIASFTKQYSMMIILVLFAIVFDIITGLIKAKINGEVSSSAGTKGFFKKVSLLVCLFFGFFLDYAIPYMCGCVHINISFDTPFGMIICFYIILNEAISVCENLYACNNDIMPAWIPKLLSIAKKQIVEMDETEGLEDTEEGAENEDLQEK